MFSDFCPDFSLFDEDSSLLDFRLGFEAAEVEADDAGGCSRG
jgi:hypothetical protein